MKSRQYTYALRLSAALARLAVAECILNKSLATESVQYRDLWSLKEQLYLDSKSILS